MNVDYCTGQSKHKFGLRLNLVSRYGIAFGTVPSTRSSTRYSDYIYDVRTGTTVVRLIIVVVA